MRCSVSLFQSLQNFVSQFDHHCTQASDESDDLGEGSRDKQPEALWRAQRPEMETFNALFIVFPDKEIP